jgi:hypothetical protein
LIVTLTLSHIDSIIITQASFVSKEERKKKAFKISILRKISIISNHQVGRITKDISSYDEKILLMELLLVGARVIMYRINRPFLMFLSLRMIELSDGLPSPTFLLLDYLLE